MLDNLKDHIDSQREDFELYPFDNEKGWKEISTKIAPELKWPKWKLASVAACLAIIVVSAFYQSAPRIEANTEISELEQFYAGEISNKITLVKTQLKDHRILEDLELMDNAFAELKADLNDNIDNEEVIAAMMENYQLKLQILEEILKELEKENSESSL
ncbi:MAG: hypothetical protein AAF391_01430 [Bacteroidota bacterium]